MTGDSGVRIVEVEHPLAAALIRGKGNVAVYGLRMIRRWGPPGRAATGKKTPPAPHAGVEEVTCVLRPAERTG